MQQFGQPDACAIDATFHRAHGTAADGRHFLVGKSLCADENQGFALIVRQALQGGLEVHHVHMTVLLGRDRQPCRIFAIRILHLAPQLAALGEVRVA